MHSAAERAAAAPPRALCAAFACIAFIAACASVPEDAGFDDVQRVLAERTALRVQWNRSSSEDQAVADEVQALLARELTADGAVQIALLNNRGLQATLEDLGIAQADLVEAGLLQNPIFEGEIRFPGSPHEPLELDVMQNFLSILYLPLHKRIAKSRFEATRLRVADAVLELCARTRAAFYSLQSAEQTLELQRTVAQSTAAAVEVARRIHDAGNGTALQFADEQAADALAQLELGTAESAVFEHREHLNVLMGVSTGTTQWKLATRLPELPRSEPALEGIEELALRKRLDLAAARFDVQALADALGLGKYAAFGDDAKLTAHFEREPDGTKTFGPGLEIPIPLFNQGQTVRARNASLLRQAEQRHAALAVEIRSAVRQAQHRTLAARKRAEYCRGVLIPLRTSIVRETQLEYNAMLVGVFQVLEAKRAEIEAGRIAIEALRDYWLARTELERVVGASLDHARSSSAEAAETSAPPSAVNAPAPSSSAEHQHEQHNEQAR